MLITKYNNDESCKSMKLKFALPMSFQFETYDPTKDYPDHSMELLMETLACAWEYVYEVISSNDTAIELPNCQGWKNGMDDLRHSIIYLTPSILVIYDQLKLIENDLPSYDWEVVPSIVRYLDKYIDSFSENGMDVTVPECLAKEIAHLAKYDISVRVLENPCDPEIYFNDTVYTMPQSDDRLYFINQITQKTIGYVEECYMTSDLDVNICDEHGNVIAKDVLPITVHDDAPPELCVHDTIDFILSYDTSNVD